MDTTLSGNIFRGLTPCSIYKELLIYHASICRHDGFDLTLQVADEDPPQPPQGSPASNIDQRSLSAVSRGSGGSGDNVSLSGTTSGGSSSHMLYSGGSGAVVARPSSPSPSVVSSVVDGVSSAVGRETDLERSEREEDERRRLIQLYVFVMRCVAYPFNAKQPTDMVRRHAKVTKQQLQAIRERFQVSRPPPFHSV